MSNRVEARWKQLGYSTTRPAGSASTVKATAGDGSELELDISADGRATVQVDLGQYFRNSPSSNLGSPSRCPALITAVVTTAPEGSAGAAGGLLNAVRQVGATVGVAVTGAFVGGSTGGLAAAMLLPAAVCALSAVLVRRSRGAV
ncbi:hypothetical protein [Kitasatospora sp. NPDC001683]